MGDSSTSDILAVDNSVWLSGLMYGGSAEELIRCGMAGQVTLVTGKALVAELMRTLRNDLRYSERAVEEVANAIQDCATVYDDAGVVNGIAAGPSIGSASILSLAKLAGATAIATMSGTKLERMGEHETIPIVTIA